MEIKRGAITFIFVRDKRLINVTARHEDGQTAFGRLANSGEANPTIWHRIEFWLRGGSRWIEPFCDRRFWLMDDYETGADAEKRPFDEGWFDLTPDEVQALQAWCDSQNIPAPAAPPVAVQSVVVDIDSGLGIGRIADADPASEALAALEAVEIMKRQAANDPHARTPRLCDCGHYDAFPMTTARGSACADCYDRWSD